MEAGDLLFRQDFSGGTSKMKTNSHRFLCALCALTVFISVLFPASAFAAQAINAPCRTGYKNDQGAEKRRSGQSRQQQEDKADQRNADADALLPARRSPEKNPKPIIVVCTATAMISVPTAVGSST